MSQILDYFTDNGKNWMNRTNPLYNNYLPFYFNNHHQKQTIINVLKQPGIIAKPTKNFFVLSKPSGIGKTTLALHLADVLNTVEPTQNNETGIYVIAVLNPNPVPTEDDLLKHALFYLKKHENDKLFDFISIKQNNIKEGINLEEMNTHLIDLQKFLKEKNKVLLFFMDEFPFGDFGWNIFTDSVHAFQYIGYLFANTDFMAKIHIGTNISSKNLTETHNFLNLPFLTAENIDYALQYFLDYKNNDILDEEEKNFLKNFISPFLIGRPKLMFYFFSTIRNILEKKPQSSDFFELMNQGLSGVFAELSRTVENGYLSCKKKGKIKENHRNYGDLLLELFFSPNKHGDYSHEENNIKFKAQFGPPNDIELLHELQLVYFEEKNICRRPERLMINCLKFEISCMQRKLKPTIPFKTFNPKFDPLTKAAEYIRNNKGKLFELIICFLLADRTSLFHQSILNIIKCKYYKNEKMNDEDFSFGEFSLITQKDMRKMMEDRKKTGIFLVTDNVTGENDAEVEKIDVLFSCENTLNSQFHFFGIQATTMTGENDVRNKYLDFCKWLNKQQNAQIYYGFASLNRFYTYNFTKEDREIVKMANKNYIVTRFDKEMCFFLERDFPIMKKSFFERLSAATADDCKQIISEIELLTREPIKAKKRFFCEVSGGENNALSEGTG